MIRRLISLRMAGALAGAALWLVIPTQAQASSASEPMPRQSITVRATLTPSPASADGRYRVDAALRVAPAVQSADGRYRVKAAAASCDPNDDGLFANGFESP